MNSLILLLCTNYLLLDLLITLLQLLRYCSVPMSGCFFKALYKTISINSIIRPVELVLLRNKSVGMNGIGNLRLQSIVLNDLLSWGLSFDV